jgi:hypothetical protein
LRQLFTNNAVSLLGASISASDMTLEVTAGFGTLYPSPGPDEFFLVTLENRTATVREIVKVTQRIGDVFVISQRGCEGTIAQTWNISANPILVDHRATAQTLSDLANDYANTAFPSLQTFPEALDYLLSLATGAIPRTYNASFTLEYESGETLIILDSNLVMGSSAVFVGGMRQKIGVDYIEQAPNIIRLLYDISTSVDDGTNVVVDFTPA